MRRALRVSGVDMLEPHDHVLWCGDGTDDLYALATAALAAGAARNEKLMFLAREPDRGRLAGIPSLELLLERGQLKIADSDHVYGTSGSFGAADQLASFEAVLADALSAGYSGIRVVADNTPLAAGDEDQFCRWLAWEQLADRFQAQSNVTGICWFDRGWLSDDRQEVLASLHPVCAASALEPPFSFFADGDAIALRGALDAWSEDQFRRILDTSPDESALVLDLSQAEFVDHRALLALNAIASPQRPVRVRCAPAIVRRMPSLLSFPMPHLCFE